jgi:wyosine [tRNA(Phe)-imidazoG37] synthetase (radical SAM superfamily)
MCIVDAPSYRGVYDSYNDLTRIIQQLRPKEILAQGGEVLVQKKSIEFLSQIKEQFPSMNIDLVTNGCVDLDVVDVIDKLFSRITISFVGFERETYRKIMGLNLDKTITFVEEVKRRGKTKLHLKYLTTPLNFHETNLFLNWSLTLAPARVEISDADTFSYIYRATKDRFWDKILERTSKDVKFEILSFKAQLLLKQTILAISLKNRQMFDINDSFIAENELKSVILFNY